MDFKKNLLRALVLWMLLGLLMAPGVQRVTGVGLEASLEQRSTIENGQILYQTGQFLQAAKTWETAAEKLASLGDIQHQALVLSYLALTYQQLGQPDATTTMDQAVALITTQKQKSPLIFAQILNNQGQLQLSQGKPEIALISWQQSEKLYRETGDRTGVIGTQLNQARSLQALGFYLRARRIYNS